MMLGIGKSLREVNLSPGTNLLNPTAQATRVSYTPPPESRMHGLMDQGQSQPFWSRFDYVFGSEEYGME